MKPFHRKMSLEEFHRFPWRLGWKNEYIGGELYVSPAELGVHMQLELTPRKVGIDPTPRPVKPADAAALLSPFLKAFRDTIDFAGYKAGEFQTWAESYLSDFFANKRGTWLTASCLVEKGAKVIGASLVKMHSRGPLLSAIFVHPSYQRKGLANALVNWSANSLLASGHSQLWSYCVLGNEASITWHLRFGFKELPDVWVAGHRMRYFHHEVERHRQLNDLPQVELEVMAEQVASWKAEWKRLKAMEEQDFWSAHPKMG